ncbi:hypothetical protein [Pseudomonas kurunegalensis]|uniref:hypothetical protein n=1 Tax=Pseudomonas kurunegalensis TaxID=485880 RepID=UPI0032611907
MTSATIGAARSAQDMLTSQCRFVRWACRGQLDTDVICKADETVPFTLKFLGYCLDLLSGGHLIQKPLLDLGEPLY